jgi:lipid-binding SYLF domain-containing protein
LASSGALAQDREEIAAAAQSTLDEMEQRDPSLNKLVDQAAGYVVFPNIGKGGFVFGGGGGVGVLFQGGKPVGRVNMTQVTVGAQIGGANFSELLLLENASAVNDLKNGRVKLAAGASVVAASAGASANVKYQKGVAVITLPKGGLLADVSVGGQNFKYEAFYRPVEPRS